MFVLHSESLVCFDETVPHDVNENVVAKTIILLKGCSMELVIPSN